MSRADYDWRLVEFNGQNLVAIIDLDRGNRSVTNDAEAVLGEIKKRVPDFDSRKIVYRDSQGEWDYLDPIQHEGKGVTNVSFRAGPRGIQAAHLEELVLDAPKP